MAHSDEVSQKRHELRGWIADDDPETAVFAYYLLHHPAGRTRLHLARDARGQPRGALAECVTGYDLFRPLVTMLADNDEALRALLRQAMAHNRPCLLLGPLHYAPVWREMVRIEEEIICRLYVLDRVRFQPIINVLVTRAQSPEGLPRYEIRSPEKSLAAANLNWRSPRFAEVGVRTEPEARGRRWGESVVSALCAELISAGITPLYLAEEENEASRRLAERVGFRETGRRLLFAPAIWSAGA